MAIIQSHPTGAQILQVNNTQGFSKGDPIDVGSKKFLIVEVVDGNKLIVVPR